jgi:hypothetical protein
MILQFLPLLLTPLLFALLAKAAAFLFRRTQLRWLHALVFGILLLVVGGTGTIANRLAGMPLPAAISLLLGLLAVLLVGGWYLGPRAKTAEGVPLQFKGGALLALVTYGLVFALGIIPAVVLPMLRHAS